MHAATAIKSESKASNLDFLWLELTNRCNLQCAHCYSQSGPYSGDKDFLTETEYFRLIGDAYDLGCRQVQFIGGEPTLNKSLPRFIVHAANTGYEFIEVFTNLVKLDDALLKVMKQHGVAVATSFYSSNPRTHNRITGSIESFNRTTTNIRRILDAGLDLRVGIIEMMENAGEYEVTAQFLTELGVKTIGYDQVRGFGRSQKDQPCSMGELCGRCASNILAIGPDGVVAPCIMSKQWAVGSVLTDTLANIAASPQLETTRSLIAAATSIHDVTCYPECGPNRSQCVPQCGPSAQCAPCGPNAGQKCQPNAWCGPAR